MTRHAPFVVMTFGLAALTGDIIAESLAADLVSIPSWSPPPARAHDPVEPRWDGDAASVLADRRIFELDDPEAAVVVPVASAPAPAPAPPDMQATELPIALTGTIVATDLGPDFATVVVEGAPVIVGPGSVLLDGKAEVVLIDRGRVLLREGDRLTTVPFDARVATRAAPASTPSTPSTPLKPEPTSRPSDVEQTGPYAYTVSRAAVEQAVRAPPEANVTPHYVEDRYSGFKLVGVRPGSLYRKLGLRSGDVVTGVDGQPITSPTQALALVEALKTKSSFEVALERRGQARTLSLTIR